MILRTFIMILAGVCSFTGYSQMTFEQSYFISIAGDTVYGQCDNVSISPKVVKFRKSGSKKAITLRPEDTREIRCGNQKFFGAEVDVEVSRYIVDEMDTMPTLNLQKQRVFLTEIVGGKRSLYWFEDRYKRPQIYIVGDNAFELLKYKKYKWYVSQNERYVVENNDFRLQLSNYLSNCTSVNQQLQTTKYDVEKIMKLFELFKECLRNPPKE